MADSTQVDTLAQPDPIDWDKFHAGSVRPLPEVKGPDGKYVRFHAQIPDPSGFDFSTTDKDGRMRIIVKGLRLSDPGQRWDGTFLKDAYLSTKNYINPETGQPMDASQAAKFLRAASYQGRPQDRAEYEEAFLTTAGHLVPVFVEWTAFCTECRTPQDGYDTFKNGEGKAVPVAACKGCGATITARLGVKSWLFPRK